MYSYERRDYPNFMETGIEGTEYELYEGAVYMGSLQREADAQKIVAALNEYDQPKDCDHCGIPIKREDIVTGAYGGTFCCEEHQRAYDKEEPSCSATSSSITTATTSGWTDESSVTPTPKMTHNAS